MPCQLVPGMANLSLEGKDRDGSSFLTTKRPKRLGKEFVHVNVEKLDMILVEEDVSNKEERSQGRRGEQRWW